MIHMTNRIADNPKTFKAYLWVMGFLLTVPTTALTIWASLKYHHLELGLVEIEGILVGICGGVGLLFYGLVVGTVWWAEHTTMRYRWMWIPRDQRTPQEARKARRLTWAVFGPMAATFAVAFYEFTSKGIDGGGEWWLLGVMTGCTLGSLGAVAGSQISSVRTRQMREEAAVADASRRQARRWGSDERNQ